MAAPIGFDAMSRRLAYKLSRLNIRREEYVFMKAMLLLNPGLLCKTHQYIYIYILINKY